MTLKIASSKMLKLGKTLPNVFQKIHLLNNFCCTEMGINVTGVKEISRNHATYITRPTIIPVHFMQPKKLLLQKEFALFRIVKLPNRIMKLVF